MKKILGHAALCICLLGASGCTSLPKPGLGGDTSWSISNLWTDEYQTPKSLAVVWSPDVMTMPGKPATRGFGGRVFFYNEKSEAIPVEGDLVVHGYFGDPVRTARNSKADKTFAFTAEQLTKHFSPSQLGASYSVWIPWDAAGGMQEQVTLIPTFRTKEQGLVQGAPAKLILIGKKDKNDSAVAGRHKLPVQTVAYRRSTTPTNPGIQLPRMGTEMKVTTIELPKEATLAKPNRAKSFELTRGPQKIAPVEVKSKPSGAGVSVGGGKKMSTSQSSKPQLPAVQKTVPLSGVPTVKNEVDEPVSLDIDINDLPKTRAYTLPPRKEMRFAHDNFVRISGMVRQASFAKPVAENSERKN
ncbi:MAG: hypothetical protein VXZ82_19440 [Planctomycetota bacterium]|nr:hypothetical protein [Planctomycetota bacterium]